MGAAFGTAKAGIGIAGIGTYRPDLIMKVGLYESVTAALANLHTVAHPDCHVWYPRRLLPRHIRPDRQRHQATARHALFAIQRIHAHGRWTVSRPIRSGCRLRDWHCRRRGMLDDPWIRHELTLAGRTLLHAPIEDLCRHGSHSYFCRSLGSLWVSLLVWAWNMSEDRSTPNRD